MGHHWPQGVRVHPVGPETAYSVAELYRRTIESVAVTPRACRFGVFGQELIANAFKFIRQGADGVQVGRPGFTIVEDRPEHLAALKAVGDAGSGIFIESANHGLALSGELFVCFLVRRQFRWMDEHHPSRRN